MLETESRLNTLINAIPGFVIFKDGNGRWLEANKFTLDYVDIAESMYKGKKNHELLHHKVHLLNTFMFSECTDEEVWNYKQMLRAEENLSFDGDIKVFEVTKMPTYHPDGTRNGLLVKAVDITDRKKAENQLKLANKVFENASEAFVVTDADNKIVTVNKAFTAVTGYKSKEVIGKNPRILKSGIHGLSFYEKMWSAIVEKGYWKGEIWNRRINGEIYPEILTISTLTDMAGKITNYISVFSDVTEQEKIKQDFILTGKIQRELLPQPIQNELFEIKTIFEPSNHVSGDFFDFVWDGNDQRLFGYVIDFMGHGLATAVQTSTLRVLFRQVADRRIPLNERLKWINEQSFRYFTEDTFAAAFCFEFDFKANRLTYCTGGINHYISAPSNKNVKSVECLGMLLGVMKDASFDEEIVPFDTGDYFVFLTDGLFELMQKSSQLGSEDFELTYKLLASLPNSKDCTDDASAILIKIKR